MAARQSRRPDPQPSGLQLVARIAADQPFLGNRSVSVVDPHFRRLIGARKPHRLGNRLFAIIEVGASAILAFFDDRPFFAIRTNPVNVVPQHRRAVPRN